MVFYLFSAPVAGWVLTALCIRLDATPLLAMGCAAIVLAFAAFNAMSWARRAVEPERLRTGRALRWLSILYAGTALLVQLILTIVPLLHFR